jgi:hypothetical protein
MTNSGNATLTLMAEYRAFAAHVSRCLDSGADGVDGLNSAMDSMMAFAARGAVGRFDHYYDIALLLVDAAMDAQTDGHNSRRYFDPITARWGVLTHGADGRVVSWVTDAE